MEITLTKEELGKFIQDISDWYNQMTMYVMTEGLAKVSPMTGRIENPRELFHRLAKQYQEENPKPDWRTLL